MATDAAVERIRGRRSARWWAAAGAVAFTLALVVPHIHAVARTIAESEQPERAAYAALRAELASTSEPIVLVCGEPRCRAATGFHFGFEPPARLIVVDVPDFAAMPLPPHARVRLITQLVRVGGAARDVADRAEALGLRRIVWHAELRLYDAGDGAQLRDALARPPLPARGERAMTAPRPDAPR
jgi:hypothetical protein